MEVDCLNCGGTGQEHPHCEECGGTGWVEDDENGGTMNCPECHNEKCLECDGEGEM